MAQMDSKVKLEALSKLLHSNQGSHEVKTIVELLQLRLDRVKNAMLTCKPDEFLKYQGEAVGYDKIIRDITRATPNIRSQEEK